MKRFAFAALFLLIAAGASAEGVDVHVAVYVDPDIAAVTAVEFKVDNLPVGPCAVEAAWNTPLVIGEVSTGIALAFSPPLIPESYLVHVGTLHITCFEPLPENTLLCVVPTDDTGKLVVIDEVFQELGAYGMAHRFNTDIPGWCECYGLRGDRDMPVFLLLADLDYMYSCDQDMPVETTATIPGAWSTIKSLY